jgi:hypothetical protein
MHSGITGAELREKKRPSDKGCQIKYRVASKM